METIQQQLNALQTSVKRQRLLNIALLGIIVAGGFIAAVRPAGDATFDKITCKEWSVVDERGNVRIRAATCAPIEPEVAMMQWFDKEGNVKIAALTSGNGIPALMMYDNVQVRIAATILPSGTVGLPTKDLNPPKKP